MIVVCGGRGIVVAGKLVVAGTLDPEGKLEPEPEPEGNVDGAETVEGPTGELPVELPDTTVVVTVPPSVTEQDPRFGATKNSKFPSETWPEPAF